MARREREAPEPLLEKIDPLIDACNLIHMDEVVLELAGNIRHRNLGALDAIHIATALRAAPLDAFVTYDTRQAEAASELGLEVLSPR